MPRNKHSPEARRRTGCWPCKQAHSRCQEQRPACGRCQRLGLTCGYGIKLLWKDDAAQRGICLGREGVWSRNGPSKSEGRGLVPQQVFLRTAHLEPVFLNTTCEHLRDDASWVDEEDDRSLGDGKVPSGHPVGESLLDRATLLRNPSYENLPYKEAYLLDYFATFICPNCSLSPSHNPYLRYIMPMSFSGYAPLRDAILSVSANQLRLLNDHRFEREAWTFKARAMSGLRESISAGVVGWPFVATVLMLCFYDISDGCDESWTTHLHGGMSVLDHVLASKSSLQTEGAALKKFFIMYFVAHQIMGLTAQKTVDETPEYEWLEDDCMEEIDPLMGCSRGLLNLIDRTSKLATRYSGLLRHRPLTAAEREHLHSTCDDLSQRICSVPQTPPRTAVNGNSLACVAEAKRTTALLYLHERLGLLLGPDDSFPPTNKPDLLSTLLSQLSALPTTPTLLWPLFVLGRASPDDEWHRRFVLDRLIEMQRVRNLGSVRLARRMVEAEYRKWDLTVEGDGPRREISVTGKSISLA